MRRLINMFGAVGYTLLTFAIAIGLSFAVIKLASIGALSSIGLPASDEMSASTQPQPTTTDVPQPSITILVLRGMAAGVLIGVMLFVMAALPYWLGRGMSRLVKRSIRYCKCAVTLQSLLMAKVVICLGYIGGIAMIGMPPMLLVSLFGIIGLVMIIFLTQHYLASSSEVVEAKDVW